MARRASAFSRQAAASCGKLVAAALRNKAAMMRRMRASSSPLPAPGRWPLALCGGGRRWRCCRSCRSWRCWWRWPAPGRCGPGALAALLVALGAPVLAAGALTGAGALAGAVGGLLAGPRAVDALAARVVRLLEAAEAAGAGPPDGRGHRSPTSASGRCPLAWAAAGWGRPGSRPAGRGRSWR